MCLNKRKSENDKGSCHQEMELNSYWCTFCRTWRGEGHRWCCRCANRGARKAGWSTSLLRSSIDQASIARLINIGADNYRRDGAAVKRAHLCC